MKPIIEKPMTLADLLAWNESRLAALEATPLHTDMQMHNLRINALEVAKESLERCKLAVQNYSEGYAVRNWMMETFGCPQFVNLRDTDGKLIGRVTVLEILNATPATTVCAPPTVQ